MQLIECWELQTWDGGDRHNFHAYVRDEESAKKWRAEHKYDNIVQRKIVIFDDVADMEANSKKELRRRALAKLTKEERYALGLGDE